MLQTYKAINGQSVLDVCLNTYGSLDFLFRLVQDSGHGSIDDDPVSGQEFTFNSELVVDQMIAAGLKQVKLATLYSPHGVQQTDGEQVLNLIANRYATSQAVGIPSAGNSGIGTSEAHMYQISKSDSYTAANEGETALVLTEWIGWDIIMIIKDIQPMKKTDYSWNKSSGTLTLRNGKSLSQGETIFFLFSKMTQ